MTATKTLLSVMLYLFFIGTPTFIFAQDLEDIPFDLPLFIINTDGQGIPNEPKLTAHLGIVNNLTTPNYFTDQFTDYNGQIGIEVRGNGSANWKKKSYLFETRTADGSNNSVSLLGMPVENDWVLYASYIDKSAMRNVLTYNLSREMGHYASRTAYCEVILNGEYKGIYVLMEKIKRDENRVDITKFANEANVPSNQGGYIIKTDSWWNDQLGWQSPTLYQENSTHWQPRYQYVYPKHDEITTDQKEYIQDYLHQVDEHLFNSKSTGLVHIYSDLIDLNSFVDLFITNEFTKNPDGYRLSTYMYLDPTSTNPKLKMGPVWDYNVGYGNYINYFNNAVGWEHDNSWWELNVRIPFWWKRFITDEIFIDCLVKRWGELRHTVLTHEKFCTKIDSIDLIIKNGVERNNQIWLNSMITEDLSWASTNSHEQDVIELKNWIRNRLEWMDHEISLMKKTPVLTSYQVYPNPTTGPLNIDLYLKQTTSIPVRILDVQGRLVYTTLLEGQQGQNTVSIYDFNAAAGTYFLELMIGENRSIQKIIKL